MEEELYSKMSSEEEKVVRAFDEAAYGEDDRFFYANLSPWQLLFNNPLKLDFKGLKRALLIIFGFFVLNSNLAIISVVKFFWYENTEWQFLLIIIGLTIIATIFAIYKAYWYAIGDMARTFYRRLFAPMIKKSIDGYIAQIAEQLRTDPNAQLSEEALDLNLKDEINKTFPKVIAKIFIALINQIPVFEFLMNAKEYVTKDEKKAADRFFNQINELCEASIAKKIHLRWLTWLIPLNIIVIVALIGIMS